MTSDERIAWLTLIVLGARKTTVEGRHALDLSEIRILNGFQMALFCSALARFGNRKSWPTFVITDDPEDPTDTKGGFS